MHQLIKDILAEARPETEPRFWYMSFCDGARPVGDQFLGGCFVAAKSVSGMLDASHRLKCNPGGEVQFSELSPGMRIPARWIARLLSKEDLEVMGDEVEL